MKLDKKLLYTGLGTLAAFVAGKPAVDALAKSSNTMISKYGKEIFGGAAIITGLVAQQEPKLRAAGNGAMIAGVSILSGAVLNRSGILKPGSALTTASNSQQLQLAGDYSGVTESDPYAELNLGDQVA